MDIWDKIYKNSEQFQNNRPTFSKEILPSFQKFLEKENFETKYVLDIGCGTGKYLKLLEENGFKTDAIDSSNTAVETSKKILKHNTNILCENMFEAKIPKNKYDLIISISTIHHGEKEQIQNLVYKIYEAIKENGKIFLTLPNIGNYVEKGFFKNEQNLGNGTYAPSSGPEQGLPHSYYTKEEVKELFSKFKKVKIYLDKHGNKTKRWVIEGSK